MERETAVTKAEVLPSSICLKKPNSKIPKKTNKKTKMSNIKINYRTTEC